MKKNWWKISPIYLDERFPISSGGSLFLSAASERDVFDKATNLLKIASKNSLIKNISFTLLIEPSSLDEAERYFKNAGID